MHNDIVRDSEYIRCLKDFIYEKYDIRANAITPAKRGYYGETWKLDMDIGSYFVKLDYLPRHQKLFQNSLSVVDYLYNSGIDFVSRIVKTCDHELYSVFGSAVLGVFEWIDGKNVETNDTKIPEYQMLCKIYPLTKPGFEIPVMEFSDAAAVHFYDNWEKLKDTQQNKADRAVLSIFEHHSEKLAHCASRLSQIALLCQENRDDFYLTHGDAGGNFFVGDGRNYIVDWDEVMYAPLERDAWVMCCHSWARKLFDDTLQMNNIPYKLRPERLAFFCYHMFFFYLGEFLSDLPLYDMSDRIEDYLDNGWINERILFADKI